MPHLTSFQWAMAALAALCIGLSKSGFSGVSMISILLMAEVLPARQSTGVILPLLVCGEFRAVGAYRRHVRWPHVIRTLPPALLGVLLGFSVLKLPIPDRLFKGVIGAVILALVILQMIRRRRPAEANSVPHGPVAAWSVGVTCGVTTMLANAAGPIMTIYLIAMELPKLEFVGTAAVFFLLINLIKIPFSASLGLINPHSLMLNLALAPAVACGIFSGRKLLGIVPQKTFESLVLLLSGLVALKLCADSL